MKKDERSSTESNDIKTLRRAFSEFSRRPSPIVIMAGVAVTVVVRLFLVPATGFSLWDLLAAAIVLAAVPFFEWTVHLFGLHAPERQIAGLKVDTGADHRQHHLNPALIEYVLFSWPQALLFQVIITIIASGLITLPLSFFGVPLLGPAATGVVVASAGLFNYEWSHFLFHTAYRPKTPYYRRLKKNHRLHHWRNEHYWLGVTTNLGDRVLRTYPKTKSDVPLSPTAKTLGVEPS